MSYDDLREQLLEAFRSMGPVWVTRAEIAQRMHKGRLNPAEHTALDVMVRDGDLEFDYQVGKRPNANAYIYRLRAS